MLNFLLAYKEATRSLKGNKQRSFLALLGIVIGVASVVAMVSIGETSKEKNLAGIKSLGTDVVSVYANQDFGMMQSNPKNGFRIDEALKLKSGNRFIKSYAPKVDGYGNIKNLGFTDQLAVYGVTRDFFRLYNLRLSKGRFISDYDAANNFCLLGAIAAKKLFGEDALNSVGKKIKINKHEMEIIGILKERRGMIQGIEANESVYIPIRVSKVVLGYDIISNFILKINTGVISVQQAVEKLEKFTSKHFLQEFKFESNEELIKAQEEAEKSGTILIVLIAGISLVVGGIGVMNIMLVSVNERKREIGIRRSIGALKKDIKQQFLIESLILSVIGGLIGIGVGVLTAVWAANYFYHWPTIINYPALLIAFTFSALIGVFFGLYPAKKAADIEIIDALKAN